MKSCMSFPPEGGWHKGSNPDCSTEHCAAHMKKIRSSVEALEPWARNAAPSAHRPGSRAAFFHSRTIILVLLWACWPFGLQTQTFVQNAFHIASVISSTTVNVVSRASKICCFNPPLKYNLQRCLGDETGCLKPDCSVFFFSSLVL